MDQATTLVVIDPLSELLARQASDQAAEKAPPVLIPDGVYFGLPEEIYHADPALGSTNIKDLRKSAPDYWWTSVHNPNRPTREDKAHHVFGRAVHKIVLEGVEPFLALYEREIEDALKTDADLVAWFAERGVTKLPRSKSAKVALALEIDPSVAIADDIKARAEAAGRTILKAEDYDRIVGAAAAIAENEELATAFQNGQPEVSIFWTIEVDGVPVRLKARFDYLKIRGVGDLKSFRNSAEVSIEEATPLAIAKFGYDVQGKHYLNGRAKLPELVRAGRVWNHPDHAPIDQAWLERVASAETFGFQWVFFQSEKSPAVDSLTLSLENEICLIAQYQIDQALSNYVRFVKRFGFDRPWREAAQIRELDISHLPAWYARR